MDDDRRRIETLITSLHGPESEKNRFRRNLWAAYQALLEEESAPGVSDADARDRAFRRLGSPDDIAADFSNTTSPLGIRLEAMAQWLVRAPGESLARYVGRTGWFFATASLIVCGTMGLAILFFDPERDTSKWWLTGAIIAPLATWAAWFYAMAGGRATAMENRLNTTPFEWRTVRLAAVAIASILGRGAAGAPVFFGLGYGTLLLVLGATHHQVLAYLYIAPWLYAFVLGVTTLTLTWSLLRSIQGAHATPDWPYANGTR